MVAGGIEKSCCNYGVRWCKMVEGLPRKCPVSCLRVRQRPMCNQKKVFLPCAGRRQRKCGSLGARCRPTCAFRLALGALCCGAPSQGGLAFCNDPARSSEMPIKSPSTPPKQQGGALYKSRAQNEGKKKPNGATVDQPDEPEMPRTKQKYWSAAQPRCGCYLS